MRRDVRDGEALLAFGANIPNAARVLNLSSTGDLVEAAANLFSHLRALDASGARGHRRDADPERRPRRGHQRPPRAGGRAAINCTHEPARQTTRFTRSPPPLRRDRRRALRHHRSGDAGAVSARDARPLSGPHPDGAAAGLGRGSLGDPQARERDQDRDRAAGRQHRTRRRADPASRRDRSLAQSPRQDPRGGRDLQHHHGGGRRVARPRARKRLRMSTGSIRCCCRPRAPARSAAISPPTRAAPRPSRGALRGRRRSGSKSCSPTAAC